MAVARYLLQKLLRWKNKEEKLVLLSSSASPVRHLGSRSFSASSSSSTSTPHHCDMLRLVFSEYDTDGDGQISLPELESVVLALGTLLGSSGASEPDTAAMMGAVDINGDGFISFDEFVCLVQGTPGTQEEEDLQPVFAVYDQNGDGGITAEELHCVLHCLMGRNGKDNVASPSVSDCRRMIAEVDLDGDGVVSFHEFAAMMGAVAAR